MLLLIYKCSLGHASTMLPISKVVHSFHRTVHTTTVVSSRVNTEDSRDLKDKIVNSKQKMTGKCYRNKFKSHFEFK